MALGTWEWSPKCYKSATSGRNWNSRLTQKLFAATRYSRPASLRETTRSSKLNASLRLGPRNSKEMGRRSSTHEWKRISARFMGSSAPSGSRRNSDSRCSNKWGCRLKVLRWLNLWNSLRACRSNKLNHWVSPSSGCSNQTSFRRTCTPSRQRTSSTGPRKLDNY
jgi:hypothetical protein